jgi:hypothetical protein
MKKLLYRTGAVVGTIGIILAGAAAFSAFEAHVVNVTATISNATEISTSALSFGNVFPQEILHNPVTLSLSSSFLSTDNTRATNVDYVIKQKPKCKANDPANQNQYAQVVDVPGISDSPATFACPVGYTAMPLLCPYLSKTSDKATDTNVTSFHGPTDLTSWTDAISEQFAAVGHLSKPGQISTTWDIDLHTPCFRGQCSQDWPAYVHTANPNVIDPTVYEADPQYKGAQMGCDLWYEVTGVRTN